MLNIPNKSQAQDQSVINNYVPVNSESKNLKLNSESYLQQLIILRQKIKQIEESIEEIMPEAINEALDIISNQSTINGKNLVYSDKQLGKIQINFRKQYPRTKENVTLQRLNEDIKAEQNALSLKHKTELNKLESQLNDLNEQINLIENKQEELLTNKRLINLKARYTTYGDARSKYTKRAKRFKAYFPGV